MKTKKIPFLKLTWNARRDEYNNVEFTELNYESENQYLINVVQKDEEGFDTPRNLVDLEAKTYVPQMKDRIYFMKGCTVPRVKLKDLSVKYKIRTTTEIDKATVVVGSSAANDKLVKAEWYYKIPYKVYAACIDYMKDQWEEHGGYYCQKEVKAFNKVLEAYVEENGENFYILCDWSASRLYSKGNTHNPSEFLKLKEQAWKDHLLTNANPQHNVQRNSQHCFVISDHNLEFLENIGDKTIIDQNGLLEVVNGEDSTTIDKDTYQNLRNMFMSSDNENHVLAMEIMANCNYKESILWLELLYYHHNHHIQYCRSKNHVNFKSLKSYLGKDNYYNQHVDTLIRGLINHDALSKEALEIIMEENVEFFNRGGYSEFIKPKTYTLSTETAANTGFYWTKDTQYSYERSDVERIPEEDPTISENSDHETGDPDSANVEEKASIEAIEEVVPVVESNEDTEEEITEEEVVSEPERSLVETGSQPNNSKTQTKNADTDFDWF